MSEIIIENLRYRYPHAKKLALDGLNFSVEKGEFIGIIGENGAGKSTLSQAIMGLVPQFYKGAYGGKVIVDGIEAGKTPVSQLCGHVGLVFQNPFNQLSGAKDNVYEEVAFGMQNLGIPAEEMKERVENALKLLDIWQYRDRNPFDLSGGQMQRVAIASVLVIRPDVMILDEPTSQLDPIAASDFLETVKKINRDIGTTVIITEHRLQDIVPYADKAFVMDKGNVFLEGSPREIGAALREQKHGMFLSMPVPMQIYGATDSRDTCPLTVSEGRQWLERYCREKNITEEKREKINVDFLTVVREGEQQDPDNRKNMAIQMKDVWFRYEKDSPDVVRDLSLEVRKGEFYALVGGNGTGKSTTLSLLSRVRQPYRGKIRLEGRDIRSFKDRELYCGCLGVMPQNPQSIFLKKTVLEDLYSVIGGRKEKLSPEYQIHMKKEKAIEGIVSLTRLEGLLDRHPYDLSGGEQQRLALAKVLLLRPRILLMDEPTKGMDAEYKEEIGKILCKLKQHGMTIFMISHDVEFVAEYADRVGLFFEGNVVTSQNTREFFSGNNFYTTAANRMARQLFPDAVTGKDVITCLQKSS